MLTDDAGEKVKRYNNYCVHYNIVAEACYRKRYELKDPFSDSYFPYLVAALISFDMGRQMGKGTKGKYDPAADGFATRLDSKLKVISCLLAPIINRTIVSINLVESADIIKNAYDELSQKPNGLHSANKSFHVGATKILHFLAPDLFPIVDSYAARVFRNECNISYQRTTQPGYCSERYIEVMGKACDIIHSYGEDHFKALESSTPMMRIFDKIVFAHAGVWNEDIA